MSDFELKEEELHKITIVSQEGQMRFFKIVASDNSSALLQLIVNHKDVVENARRITFN